MLQTDRPNIHWADSDLVAGSGTVMATMPHLRDTLILPPRITSGQTSDSILGFIHLSVGPWRVFYKPQNSSQKVIELPSMPRPNVSNYLQDVGLILDLLKLFFYNIPKIYSYFLFTMAFLHPSVGPCFFHALKFM